MTLIGSNCYLLVERPGEPNRDDDTGQTTPTYTLVSDECEAAVSMLDFKQAVLDGQAFTTRTVVAHVDYATEIKEADRITVPPELGPKLAGVYLVTIVRDVGRFYRVLMEETT